MAELVVTTPEGYKFYKQSNGTWGNDDMSWNSLEELLESVADVMEVVAVTLEDE